MQKLYVGPVLFFFILCFPGCKEQTQAKDPRINQVNEWYGQQSIYWQSNGDSVLKYAVLIDSLAKGLPPVYQAMGLMGKARYHISNKPTLSMKMFEQALVLLHNTGADSITARVFNSLGIGYIKKSDYSNALDYYFKALRLYEKDNNVVSTGGVLANIGEVYQLKNDIVTAKKYILRSMQTSKKAGSIPAYLDAAQTLANIHGMSNEFDSAIAIDRMGVAMSDSIGSTKLKSAFYNNLGNCYMYSNRPDSARFYFTQCLLLDSANGLVNFMLDNYLTLGQLSLQQNDLGQAEQFLKRAIGLSDSVNEKRVKSNAWSALASLYKKENKLLLAINARDSAMVVKDEMINEKTENKIAELQELYEAEKKEQTIALQSVRLSRQRLLLIGSVVLLASLLLSAWLLYRRYKIRKEKEMQARLMLQREQAMLDILQAEDQERRRIAAELHDGVGQVMLAAWMNLQAMETQLNTLEPAQQATLTKAIHMVGEGCKEVREVSHSMMPGVLLNKGLEGAVRELAQQVDSTVLSIQLHTEGLEQPIDDMVETILYRVIQESVNNAIKHAAASELDISIHRNEKGISLLIEDNGKGFDIYSITSGNTKDAGLGLQNIKRRIDFLMGTAEWDSSPGNGTVVTIFVPAKMQHG